MKKHKCLTIWILSVLLAATPIMSPATCVPESMLSAFAEEDAAPFEYNNCGDHIEITRYTSSKYVMNIPEQIDGIPVTKIAPGAFSYNNIIGYVYLPETIEEIGESAFAWCPNLTTIDFPLTSTLKAIGTNAFYHCASLEAIILPNSVEEVGVGAFSYSGLHHAILSTSLRKIEKGVFANDSQMDSVVITAGTERIEEGAFKGCDSLNTICYKGSANDWAVISIGSENEALQMADLVCDYNQPKIERSYTFDPGRDRWSFTNKDVGYYVMPDETFTELTAQMSHTEQAAAETYWEWAKEQYNGCCAGMTETAMLAAAGILVPASLDPEANCLYDVRLTDEVRELLTYYQIMANSISAYENDVYTGDEIFNYLANGIPLLLCYYMMYPTGNEKDPYTDAGHAVLAYSMEEGRYEYEGVVYQKKILTYDNNLSTDSAEEGFIYADPMGDVYGASIYVPYWVAKGATNMITQSIRQSLDLINIHGVDKGIAYCQPEQIHPLLRSYALPSVYTVRSFTPDQSDRKSETDYQTGTTGMTQVISFSDAAKGYEIAANEAQIFDCSMSYEHWWYSVEGSKLNSIAFAPDGCVSVNGQNTDYTVTIVADEGHPATSFYKLSFSGDHTDGFAVTQTDEGIVINASELNDIEVQAVSDDAWISFAFSTDAKQVLLSESEMHSLSVLADADGDGAFETTVIDHATDCMGDVSEDGVVNASDAAKVLIAAAKLGADGASGLTESQEKSADANGDGVINATDAAWILQYAAVRGSGENVTMRSFMKQ